LVGTRRLTPGASWALKEAMTPCRGQRIRSGFTLIELLCVIAILMLLAGLVLGVGSRVLKRVLNDQWGEKSMVRLHSTVEQLQKHFRGKQEFPPVTLEKIQAEHLVGSLELDFLKDRRVTFIPFAGSDSEKKVVIRVELQRGYFTEEGIETATKGSITSLPK
jgi:prepilin-type N-terminal cleavage/methylation domain-containing protein